MVYWEDIPSDEKYLSPFHPKPTNSSSTDLRIEQFLTFEPDGGGWSKFYMVTCLGGASYGFSTPYNRKTISE